MTPFNIYLICVWGTAEPFQSDLHPCLLCNSYIFSPSRTWVICVCMQESMRLLVGTLYPGPVVAALFIGAVIVGLSAAPRRRALADIIILQVDLLCVSSDDGRLWSWGQHVLQLLHMRNIHQDAALIDSLIVLSNHAVVPNSCGTKNAGLQKWLQKC